MPVRRLPPSELGLVEPIWASLLAHHAEADPELATRPAPESWAMRRADYERWLADEGSFALLAEAGGEPAGYAFVHVTGPDETWVTSERMAEVETLAVLPDHRGAGLGAELMDAVEARLAELGIEDMWVAVVSGNEAALRFYERHGMRTYMHRMHRRLRLDGDG